MQLRLRFNPNREDTNFSPETVEAVDELGSVVATGVLEVEYLPGAQRHGSIVFVTAREEVDHDASATLARAQAGEAA